MSNDPGACPSKPRRAAPTSLVLLSFSLAACAAGSAGSPAGASAHPPVAHAAVAAPAPVELPIWPGAVPDAVPLPGPENQTSTLGKPVAGKPWTKLENVAHPTMTIYRPAAPGPSPGAAVVVFPGGGYKILAVDLEGTEVCTWLTSIGVTCVVLEYRVPFSGPHWDESCNCHVMPPVLTALEDAQRTIGLLRYRAGELHIDPHRIGVLGFSAGGHLVAASSTHVQRIYAAVDAADQVSCRPDFAIALYPGHLWKDDEKRFELEDDIAGQLTGDAPPTFIVQATDDPVDSVNHSLVYYRALVAAGVSVEMHLFSHGGHAFGLRPTDQPITRWPVLAEAWLHTIGIL
jgi:acetyl esterase/lipase